MGLRRRGLLHRLRRVVPLTSIHWTPSDGRICDGWCQELGTHEIARFMYVIRVYVSRRAGADAPRFEQLRCWRGRTVGLRPPAGGTFFWQSAESGHQPRQRARYICVRSAKGKTNIRFPAPSQTQRCHVRKPEARPPPPKAHLAHQARVVHLAHLAHMSLISHASHASHAPPIPQTHSYVRIAHDNSRVVRLLRDHHLSLART